MKISDFKMTHVKGQDPLDLEYFAEVAVTTTSGRFWWKRTKTERRLVRRAYAGAWHFVDDGTYTPGHQVEALERSYNARRSLAKLNEQ